LQLGLCFHERLQGFNLLTGAGLRVTPLCSTRRRAARCAHALALQLGSPRASVNVVRRVSTCAWASAIAGAGSRLRGNRLLYACLGPWRYGSYRPRRARRRRELALGVARGPLDQCKGLARLGEHSLRLPPELAQALLLGLGAGEAFERLALGLGAHGRRGAGLGLLELDRRQAVALGKPLRGGRRPLGRGSESVPTPQIALARDEALAGA
jgi:hypothetical protein